MLVPTRELASQVHEVLGDLLGNERKRVVSIFGGTGYREQVRALQKGVNIVVACPGRLEDLIERGDVRLDDVTTVVLDEADRMSDMGFLPAVRRLLDQTAAHRQVMLFSATIGREVESIIRSYQRDPVKVAIEATAEAKGDVDHHFWKVDRAERVAITAKLIERHGQAFVFCRTKRGADRVVRQLQAHGVRAVPMHGNRSQGQRERALDSFAKGRADALVATDVVARGIHVDGLPCVVHFDPPTDHVDYVHRSGRTGRAGRTGTVVSLVTPEQRQDMHGVQRALGLEPVLLALLLGNGAGAAGVGHGRFVEEPEGPEADGHGEILQQRPRLRVRGAPGWRGSLRAPLAGRRRRQSWHRAGHDGGVHHRYRQEGRRGPQREGALSPCQLGRVAPQA